MRSLGAKIVRLRPRPQKSPAFGDREPESAKIGPDRGDLVLYFVGGVGEGRKRSTAYSEAAVRVIERVADRPVLRAENGVSTEVRWRKRVCHPTFLVRAA